MNSISVEVSPQLLLIVELLIITLLVLTAAIAPPFSLALLERNEELVISQPPTFDSPIAGPVRAVLFAKMVLLTLS